MVAKLGCLLLVVGGWVQVIAWFIDSPRRIGWKLAGWVIGAGDCHPVR